MKKFIKEWDYYFSASEEFVAENAFKGRVTLKYRNKPTAKGILTCTNDNQSMMYKFTQRSDIDKLDFFLDDILHILSNKPRTEKSQALHEAVSAKKKLKKNKKH